MPTPITKSSTPVRLIILGLLILIAGVVVTIATIYGTRGLSALGKEPEKQPPARSRLAVELVEDLPHSLSVPESVCKALGIQESAPVKRPLQGRSLVMPGSTALDPGRVMRVRTRFNAEVVDIAVTGGPEHRTDTGQSDIHELRPGDRVKKGDRLATVWSTDVGARKCDLVDALVQLRLDEKRLKNREDLFAKGSIPEDTLDQTRHDVISDRNAKERAERTLRTWNIPDKEIEAVYAEAELVTARQGKRDPDKERQWARSDLIAPRDGTIVERNVSAGEYVADNTISLFTIADVDRLLVMANPPEDQLPELLRLKPRQMRWSLETVGTVPIEGPIEEIGYLVDPNQHTAVVKGYINNPKGDPHPGTGNPNDPPGANDDNAQGRLRAGQFVSATVKLDAPPDVVEVLLTALAEDGKQSFVFVQPDVNKPNYTMRRVKVTHRFENTAFVRSRLAPAEEKLTPEEQAQGLYPLQPLKPESFEITDRSLQSLRAAQVPETVLTKLKSLKDKAFDTDDQLTNELKKLLAREEEERFAKLVLKHAYNPPDRIITSGVLELRAALEDKESKAK